MRKKDKSNFVKVGVYISGLTFVLMVLVVSIGKENSIFDPKIDLKARVQSVSNLKPGSYVELRGIRVGAVSRIEIVNDDEVEVTATILKSHLKWIKQDSRVSVSTAGLVGDKFLEIYNGSKEAPVFDPKHDTLISENNTNLKAILTKGESIATITERILSRLDQVLANLDDGKKIVEAIDSINRAGHNLDVITKEVKEAHVGTAIKEINSSMKKMDGVMTRIEKGPGTMHSLIYDDSVHEDLRALLGGAERNKVIKYFIRESIKNSERKKPQAD